VKWLRRIVVAAAVLAVVWLAALLVIGLALEGRTRRGVASRLAESLKADATIDRGSLSLVRGRIDLDELSVQRADLIGQLSLRIAGLSCDLPPLGLALFDRSCRELAIRGTRLDVSTFALFRLPHPKRPPLHAAHLVIDDARLELAATALFPNLGRVTIQIAHAEAGDTVFKTPLSFLFALQALDATIDLPGNVTLHLTYQLGQLQVAGSIFGSTPVALPLTIPLADLTDDASAEITKLVALGKDLAERLIAQRAEAWLKSQLSP
jgi:hypothetical protein